MHRCRSLAAPVLALALLLAITPAFALSTQANQARSSLRAARDCERFIADVTIRDGSVLTAGATEHKEWRVKNCGSTTWNHYRIVLVYGEGSTDGLKHATVRSAIVPKTPPNTQVTIAVPIYPPSIPGEYHLEFELALPGGIYRFGDVLWADFTVQ